MKKFLLLFSLVVFTSCKPSKTTIPNNERFLITSQYLEYPEIEKNLSRIYNGKSHYVVYDGKIFSTKDKGVPDFILHSISNPERVIFVDIILSSDNEKNIETTKLSTDLAGYLKGNMKGEELRSFSDEYFFKGLDGYLKNNRGIGLSRIELVDKIDMELLD